MYTLNSQPIFNPMQTTYFKRAHTGTCMDTVGYDINSMVVLSNLFQLNNNKMKEQIKDDNLDQNLIPNIISNNGLLPTNLQQVLKNQTTSANLLNSLNTTDSTANDNLIFNNSILSYYQQLQDMPTTVFNIQNSTSTANTNSVTFNLAKAIQLATELNKSTNQLNRPTKKQKTIPNPLQLTYSNLNPLNQQNEPLDLSIKSASSTNSEHFIMEPLNLSRSNTPEDDEIEKTIVVNNKNSKLINSNTNLVQIQNALCKKKKIMAQQAAELLKKSSFSSAPNSPSSIATSSSPSDQPFDLDGSHSNQSNLNFLTNETAILNQLNKKRKFSDSSFNLNSSSNSVQINLQQQTKLPKLQAKRKLNKQRKTSVNSEESIELAINQQQLIKQINQEHKPNTIIIDAKNTFTCTICGEMFAYKDRLSKHIKSKHRNTINLNNQIQENNTNEQQSQTSQQQLNGRNSPNQNQRNYVCKTCNRAFARSDMLTRHSRVHSGLKPYACDICKAFFTRSDHLATHKRTHSGEKPYQCSQCSYTACRRDMITRHMKTHRTQANGTKSKPSCVVLLVPSENKAITNEALSNTTSNTSTIPSNVTSTVTSTVSSAVSSTVTNLKLKKNKQTNNSNDLKEIEISSNSIEESHKKETNLKDDQS